MDAILAEIFLFFLVIDVSSACWGWGDPEDKPPPSFPDITINATNVTFNSKHELGRNINDSWGGWTPPMNIRKQWAVWLELYKESQAVSKAPKEYLNERLDWPYTWQDLGGGNGGDQPPPWAYAPRNTGLPDFCFLKPEKGNCTKQLKRWGYNPYTNECAEFTYSGCGENRNNFLLKLRCEQACLPKPVSGCETEVHIDPDDINNNK